MTEKKKVIALTAHRRTVDGFVREIAEGKAAKQELEHVRDLARELRSSLYDIVNAVDLPSDLFNQVESVLTLAGVGLPDSSGPSLQDEADELKFNEKNKLSSHEEPGFHLDDAAGYYAKPMDLPLGEPRPEPDSGMFMNGECWVPRAALMELYDRYNELACEIQGVLQPFTHAGEFGSHSGFMRWVSSHRGKVTAERHRHQADMKKVKEELADKDSKMLDLCLKLNGAREANSHLAQNHLIMAEMRETLEETRVALSHVVNSLLLADTEHGSEMGSITNFLAEDQEKFPWMKVEKPEDD